MVLYSSETTQFHTEHVLSYQSLEFHTVAILSRYNGDQAMGSGVLIDIQNRRFVATAHHCTDEAVILTDGIIIPRDGSMPAPLIPILNKGSNPALDIAFLELPQTCTIKTAREHRPCTIDQFYIGNKVPPDSIIHLLGWPQYRAKRLGPNDISRTLEGQMVKFKNADNSRLTFHFAGKAGTWDATGNWTVQDTPSPHGYSGGGCWAITKAKDDEVYAPTKTTKLLAIQTHWDTVGVCTATLISEWVRLIGDHYPDLRAFMLAELSKN
jgi:hypothetical protein